ncbi:MAG: hypothetical protein MUD08_12635 [Cytophagales bacterium]|nr:hypothetical protein [Cytophagales bacterium]
MNPEFRGVLGDFCSKRHKGAIAQKSFAGQVADRNQFALFLMRKNRCKHPAFGCLRFCFVLTTDDFALTGLYENSQPSGQSMHSVCENKAVGRWQPAVGRKTHWFDKLNFSNCALTHRYVVLLWQKIVTLAL